jgi:3-hydroxybutyryl-CoA dehydrogenase
MEETAKLIIGVIGAGTMGSGIAQVAATAGHDVLIFDSNSAVLARASDERKKSLLKLAEKGKLTPEEANAIQNRILSSESMKILSSCDLIIEAIVENEEIKQKVFSDLDSLVKNDCILASNTSSLSITSIAAACKNASRVIGLHFFNPAPLMPLVEIVPGLATDPAIVKKSVELMAHWKKSGVVAKDTPGFIVNRVARPFYGEAIRIFEEQWKGLPAGEKGMATIDWAMKEIGGFRMGPFELMDLIGNDINYTVTETVWKQFFYDPRYKPSLTQKRLFESGRFGKKSGRGYYDYAPSAILPEPEKNSELGSKIFTRILAMLINEAADALYFNVASCGDIDLAMTKGVNYPKGLLKWCDELGADTIVNELMQLRSTYSEERYRPSVLLQRMAKNNSRFYN